MDVNKSATLGTPSKMELTGFIDDYSQLRLSYYQNHDNDSFGTSDFDFQTSESGLQNDTLQTELNDTERSKMAIEDGNDTSQTELSDTERSKMLMEDERQRLREYYISQIPDFPHPSITVASIIASASAKMGSQFRYNDRIEQGVQKTDSEMEFSPQRRSTLLPKRNFNN